MQLKVLFFGALTDVTGCTNMELDTSAANIELLVDELHSLFPGLSDHSYKIAVNEEFASFEKKLSNGDEIALLPHFAGG